MDDPDDGDRDDTDPTIDRTRISDSGIGIISFPLLDHRTMTLRARIATDRFWTGNRKRASWKSSSPGCSASLLGKHHPYLCYPRAMNEKAIPAREPTIQLSARYAGARSSAELVELLARSDFKPRVVMPPASCGPGRKS